MIPQIFKIGPIPVNSFGLMVALSLFACVYQQAKSFKISGINPALAERYVFVGGLTGLLGARFWYIATHWTEMQAQGGLVEALLAGGGFVFYGGFIVAFTVLCIMAHFDGIGPRRFLDSVGPTLTLGYAIGRVGCQLSGDGDYGRVTDSIFGMSYSQGVVPTPPGELHFPTPLFESAMALLVLYILNKVETKPFWQVPWRRFGLYLVLMAIERFLIEFLRINPRIAGGFSEAQFFAMGMFASGLLLLYGKGVQTKQKAT